MQKECSWNDNLFKNRDIRNLSISPQETDKKNTHREGTPDAFNLLITTLV